jgi:hypothetical protein
MSEGLDKNTIQQIDDFIADQMTPEQRKLFLQRISEDQSLQQEVAFRQELYTMMGSADWPLHDVEDQLEGVKELRDTLRSKNLEEASVNIKKAAAAYHQKKSSPTRKLRPWIPIAIAAACIAIIFTIVPSNNSLSDYYNDYHSWDQLPSNIEKANEQSALTKGEVLFNNKQYKETINLLEASFTGDEQLQPNVLLYKAAAYQELKQYDKAHAVYNQLIATTSLEQSRGLWFKCMLYLKQEDLENTIRLLATITSDSNNYNYAQALELQTELTK